MLTLLLLLSGCASQQGSQSAKEVPEIHALCYEYLKDAASAGHEDAQVLVAALSDEPGAVEEEDEIVVLKLIQRKFRKVLRWKSCESR